MSSKGSKTPLRAPPLRWTRRSSAATVSPVKVSRLRTKFSRFIILVRVRENQFPKLSSPCPESTLGPAARRAPYLRAGDEVRTKPRAERRALDQ